MNHSMSCSLDEWSLNWVLSCALCNGSGCHAQMADQLTKTWYLIPSLCLDRRSILW